MATFKKTKIVIPQEVKFIIDKLRNKGFQAYIVGGCVRDILRGVKPQDWDVATNAKPEEIGKIFLKSFADNNKFGTVTVLTDSQDPRLKEIEVTTYRIDEKSATLIK
jgi:tRNA nucleotidyltransferase/poly(A) polymerase